MDFGQALEELRMRMRVRRVHWRPGRYLVLARVMGLVMDEGPAGEVAWRPEQADLLAEDWEYFVGAPSGRPARQSPHLPGVWVLLARPRPAGKPAPVIR